MIKNHKGSLFFGKKQHDKVIAILKQFPDRLRKAMDAGALSRDVLETSAKRILSIILKFD